MTLTRRALVILLPVVLVSNLLVAVAVYWIERGSRAGTEIARLSRQMERLQSLFDRDLQFVRNVVYMMAEGGEIATFLRETDDRFRATTISVAVQDRIEFLSDGARRFGTFALLGRDLTAAYYFERSDDPFASIGPAQTAAARRLLDGAALASDEYTADGDPPLIVHSELRDPVTSGKPLATQTSQAIVVQAAVRPDAFLALKAQLEAEYGAPVRLSHGPPAQDGWFTFTGELMPGLEIGLSLTDAYMDRQLQPLRGVLAAGCLTMSIGSVGLLLFLIRRTVTGPIAALDRQVTEVFAGRQAAIVPMGSAGEIGRLSSNIKSLHDGAVDALRRVQTASFTDPLTGLGNRSHFTPLLDGAIETVRREGGEVALLFVDLDNFKLVNDCFGHAAGDTVLVAFSRILKEIASSSDGADASARPLVARLSGDEFAVLLCGRPVEAAAQSVAERVVAALADGIRVDGQAYPVSASVGIASLPRDAASATDLVSRADRAMYEAKAAGKGIAVRFTAELAEKDKRAKSIEQQLTLCDPDAEFELVYMPIVSRQFRVDRCEALLRWQSPLLGAVSPGEFIPIAETCALFHKIDAWVLDRALGDLPALRRIYGPDVGVCINVSSAQLGTGGIVDQVVETARRHGVEPSAIELELTETFAVKRAAKARDVIQALKAAGFAISLDDFGSGFTSLRHVLDFPLDTVKLDRELVARAVQGGQFGELKAIVELCHLQNYSVVAEGVESHQMFAALSAIGCDLFQGFGIQRPARIAELQRSVSAETA